MGRTNLYSYSLCMGPVRIQRNGAQFHFQLHLLLSEYHIVKMQSEEKMACKKEKKKSDSIKS